MNGPISTTKRLFSGLTVHDRLELKSVAFRGDVDFNAVELLRKPTNKATKARHDACKSPSTGVYWSDVRFEKGIDANWKRFLEPSWLPFVPRPIFRKCDAKTWRSLSAAFKASNNLVGQNEAYYHERLYANWHDPDENHFWNPLSAVLWGYGVRPVRLAAWLGLVTVLFAGVYGLAFEAPPSMGRWARFKALLAFSVHTAWSFDFGLKNAIGLKWKVATLIQSLLSKIMLVCLAQALANVSPLLHDIVGKFIEF